MIRYLIHLVGDVHQPLHIGNSFDLGGNWCTIKYPLNFRKHMMIENSTPTSSSDANSIDNFVKTNLHSFWDTTLVENIFYLYKKSGASAQFSKSRSGYVELADLIMEKLNQNESEYVKIQSDSPMVWYNEAQKLHSQVYPDGDNQPTSRSYCKIFQKDANGKKIIDSRGVAKINFSSSEYLVNLEYINKSSEIIKNQILKAGFRLANLLNEMANRKFPGKIKRNFQDEKIIELNQLLKDLVNE